jgi:hypothetical protein
MRGVWRRARIVGGNYQVAYTYRKDWKTSNRSTYLTHKLSKWHIITKKLGNQQSLNILEFTHTIGADPNIQNKSTKIISKNKSIEV